MKRKWDRAAMRFASAKYVSHQGMIDVTFQNGDHFRIASESVLPRLSQSRPSGSELTNVPDWSKMRISDTCDVIEVPATGTVIEIPWDRIRSLADPDFRMHLAEKTRESSRRLGNHVRSMRLEAGLTRLALAEKVGATREGIADLEVGKSNPDVELIKNIALALGKRLRDFAGSTS